MTETPGGGKEVKWGFFKSRHLDYFPPKNIHCWSLWIDAPRVNNYCDWTVDRGTICCGCKWSQHVLQCVIHVKKSNICIKKISPPGCRPVNLYLAGRSKFEATYDIGHQLTPPWPYHCSGNEQRKGIIEIQDLCISNKSTIIRIWI